MSWRSDRHRRLMPGWWRATALTSLLLAATLVGSPAAGQRLTVMLRLDRCQPEQLGVTELAALLQVELPPIVSRPVTVAPSPASPLTDPAALQPAALQINIQCHDRHGSPALVIQSREPVVDVQTAIPLTDVLPGERTRTMAIAIAEFLRGIQDQLPAPTILSPPSAAVVTVLKTPPTGHRKRLRRSTVALLAVGGVTLTAGLVLGSLSWSSLVHGPGGDIVGGIGYGALGLSGLSLATLGLTLGLNRR